jgi:thiamine-monophosphate kinase
MYFQPPQDPQSTRLGEFDLIQRFFKMHSEQMLAANPGSVTLGIGDDCALLANQANEDMAITSDMLVEGRHFFAGANPEWLGWKALAVNLSDLAAMGAQPLGFTLAIALPSADPHWLERFSKGLFAIANRFSCPLIGGDTTAGPLNICITAFGSTYKKSAIRRSTALDGDDIWVSGCVGDARLALAALRHEIQLPLVDLDAIESQMHQPVPRVELGLALRGIAHAAIDVSDGLLGDLKHVLRQSQKDAEIVLDQLPKSPTLLKQPLDLQRLYASCGGDDYELCFTAPTHQRTAIENLSTTLQLPLTHIGTMKPMKGSEPEMTLIDHDGKKLPASTTDTFLQSFDHFA